MTRPLLPSEVSIEVTFPTWVWDVFNHLIKTKWSGEQARIMFGEARLALTERAEKEGAKYERFYMDVEGAYRAVGWRVDIDNPDYTESHEGSYTFKKKSK